MKKTLIITYYWPPAGGPGVQRWLKFVKYLRDFEVDPVVYIPENPDYPFKDESFLGEVPEDITVLRHPIFEPYALASVFSKKKSQQLSSGIISEKKQSFTERLLLWIRGNFFIPDARKFWVKPSVRFLSTYLKENNIDTIITTGPPHSVHLIGMQLKEKCGVRWISDFRDPWTTIGYHKRLKLTGSSRRKHKQLEREVLRNSDQIVVTSKTTKKEFEAITQQPIEVITNGYDRHGGRATEPDKLFSLSHIGSLLSGRNPEILWQSLSELTREREDFKKDLELKLAGVVSEDILKSIEAQGLKPYLNMPGYLSHEDALKMQRSARLLLLIEINSKETECIIPGKLFEYMVAGRPILAIGPENWDVRDILKDTNTGVSFSYEQKTELKEKIVSCYEDYKRGALESHPIGLQQYSRKSLTQKLASIIHKGS
ncbi:glycosyltransferase [Leptobacterium flavescens]|uniref:Glycosyltransferase n=1 Tax=Leptobacterium flavescens TaxID=472055 RepID=A0A6P0UMY5_9FLAO|nr:glycosyltransferase family 4 protein [Leptobacterium flavescens]NER13830.1 glycosyltransferase [Leptobacterium flavescens]